MMIFALLLLLLAAPVASEAACTPGTDCYCDHVRDSGHAYYDTSLLICEDFEAPTLTGTTGTGNGAPWYGPWFDATGQAGDRGHNTYWFHNYPMAADGSHWSSGQPATPTYGAACGYSLCNGVKPWDATDRWNANALSPRMAIFNAASDFSAEVGTLSAPTSTASGTAGVFDGNANLALRIGPGDAGGVVGAVANWSAQTTLGITMVVAYPTNLATSHIPSSQWKHNEFITTHGASTGEGLLLFGHGDGDEYATFPFYQFSFYNTLTQGACNTALAAATVTTGSLICDSTALTWYATTATYSHLVDWPLGTWACVRAYYQNMGSSSASGQIWFTGPSGVETKVVDWSGMDTTGLAPGSHSPAGYYGYSIQAYANLNQGGSPSTVTTFRYEDNIHIRAGSPVSCSQAGYTAAAASTGKRFSPSINLRRAESSPALLVSE